MGLIGNTIIAFPPKFPSAFPCSIKVGSQIFYEYVLLRLQEIEDDETYIINNKERIYLYLSKFEVIPFFQVKQDLQHL